MTDSVHFLTGAFAVDALDDLERSRFEAHLRTCADCQEEVASLQIAAADLGASVKTPPPLDLRADILSAISTVRPLPPIVSTTSAGNTAGKPADLGRHAARGDSRWRFLAVAAAVLTVACLSWAVVAQRGLSSADQRVAQAQSEASQAQVTAADALKVQNLMTAADLSVDQSTAVTGIQSFVFRSQSQGAAALMVMNLPDPGPGLTYQAWNVDAKRHASSAGTFDASAGRAMVLLSGDVDKASQVAVTVEPAGGSAAPSGAPVTQLTLSS